MSKRDLELADEIEAEMAGTTRCLAQACPCKRRCGLVSNEDGDGFMRAMDDIEGVPLPRDQNAKLMALLWTSLPDILKGLRRNRIT